MEDNGKEARHDSLRPIWEIDPTEIGTCHLGDFFVQEILLLEGVASLLGDLAMLADVPGEYPKVVNLGIDGIWGLKQTIERGTESLRRKFDALFSEMNCRGWTARPAEGTLPPSQDPVRPARNP